MGDDQHLLPILNALEAEFFRCGTTLLHAQTRAAYFLRTHRQPFTLITQITAGALLLQVGDVSYRVEPGQGLVIPAQLPYRLTLLDEAAVSHWVNVEYTLFDHFSLFDFMETPLVLAAPIAQRVGLIQQSLLTLNQSTTASAGDPLIHAVKGKQHLYALLDQVLSVSTYIPGSLENMQSRRRFEPVIAYIETHLAEKLKVADLAQLMFLSTSHFHKTFQEAFTLSPLQYIQSRRLKKAQLLLATSSATIQEIARLVGYETSFAFTRFFKSATGENPGSYRYSFRQQSAISRDN